MLSKKVEEALNNQINAEYYSSYLYLSMSAYLESINFSGMGHWMRVQAKEELEHVMKFYAYIHQRDGRVLLKRIDEPPVEWKSAAAVFQHAYEHEQKVTGLIHALVDLAISEKDHATKNFLQWYVDEQVEEEATTNKIVEKFRMIGDAPTGLFMLDRELSQRQ